MDAPHDEQAGAGPKDPPGDSDRGDAGGAMMAEPDGPPLDVTLPTRASDHGQETVSWVDPKAQGKGNKEPALLAPHTVVGRYIVLEHLGSGGMGVVYKAYDPDLNRQIALKLVRVEASDKTDPSIARGRLLREAQGLAQLSHPNVVAVYDVGLFEDGVFLAMELVAGPTLRRWLETRPGYRDVLRVFVAAGEGLKAAHRAGLVHRDFKPDNVILGDDGRPRVLDFGLVRAVESGDPDDSEPSGSVSEPSLASIASTASIPSSVPASEIAISLGESRSDSSSGELGAPLTRVGAVLGTPRYMSPEQILGRTADAQSDQFSFCVALYRALYGEPPFEARTLHGLYDAIRDGKVQPPPAGVRVPAAVRRAVVKGLAPDADDRHPSMEELLVELRRDPARVWRQRLVVAAVALSLGFGAWSVVRARDESGALLCQGAADELAAVWNPERRETVKAALLGSGVSYAGDTFERVASVLDRYGEAWVAMRTEACEARHVHGVQSDKVLDLRMRCLDRKLGSLDALADALADAPDRQVVTNAVQASRGLGGLDVCADVAALEQEVLLPESPEDRRVLEELRRRLAAVDPMNALGKYRDAEALVGELAPQVEALGFAPLEAEFEFYKGSTLDFLGQYAEAEVAFKRSIELALGAGMDELVAKGGATASYLVGYRLSRPAEGLVFAMLTRGLTRGRGDELEANALKNIAIVQHSQGHYEEAAGLLTRALAILEKALGPDHPDLGRTLNNLAVVHRKQGHYAEAEALHKRTLDIRIKSLGPEHPDVATSLNNYAIVLLDQGKYAEAETLYKRAIGIREKALGPDHPGVGNSLFSLAAVYRKQEKHAEARELLERALEIWETALGADHPLVASALVGLGLLSEKQGRLDEALALLQRAQEIQQNKGGSPGARAQAAFALARVLAARGQERGRARRLAQEALELYRAAGAKNDEERRDVEQWLAEHR